MRQYIADIRHKQLLQKFYALWGPVLTLTFSVIPKQYRFPLLQLLASFGSLFSVTYLRRVVDK